MAEPTPIQYIQIKDALGVQWLMNPEKQLKSRRQEDAKAFSTEQAKKIYKDLTRLGFKGMSIVDELPDARKVETTELPPSVIAMAERYDLPNEAGEILYSEDQGESQYATLCVDRWLTARSGQVRLELRIIQRKTNSDEFETCGESILSEPLSEAQALQLVNHWGRSSQAAVLLSQQNERDERERLDALGPRPKQPWEDEPIMTTTERQTA